MYFTNQELNDYLGKTIDAQTYQDKHDYVKQRIENYCHQEFETNTYSESKMYDVAVSLNHQPIQTITSVLDSKGNTIDTMWYDTYSWGVAFISQIPRNPSGLVTFFNEPVFSRKVTVNYTAGWIEVPQPIKELALWMTRRILIPQDQPDDIGIASIASGGVTITYQHADLNLNKLTGSDYWDTIANQYRIRSRVG